MAGRGNTGKQGALFTLSSKPDDSYERSCMDSGYKVVAGVDEAGRGPLAGPVVAAAVVLPLPCPISGINDSKQVDPDKRERLYDEIIANSLAWRIGMSEPETVDEINILQATLQAMKQAITGLCLIPDIVLVDGISRIPMKIPQKLIKKGDCRSLSIAAASILAKVTRDRIMRELHRKYPEYGFDSHFGYGTPEHLEAISRHGPCPAHRKTFRGVKDYITICR